MLKCCYCGEVLNLGVSSEQSGHQASCPFFHGGVFSVEGEIADFWWKTEHEVFSWSGLTSEQRAAIREERSHV